MDNLKSPAYPVHIEPGQTYVGQAEYDGFTKLEKAALMIAEGFVARIGIANSPSEISTIAYLSTELAKSVIEEANK